MIKVYHIFAMLYVIAWFLASFIALIFFSADAGDYFSLVFLAIGVLLVLVAIVNKRFNRFMNTEIKGAPSHHQDHHWKKIYMQF